MRWLAVSVNRRSRPQADLGRRPLSGRIARVKYGPDSRKRRTSVILSISSGHLAIALGAERDARFVEFGVTRQHRHGWLTAYGGHGYIAMVPKLLAGVAVGTKNGNASHASRPAPARPTVTVSNWPPAIGDANTGIPAGIGFTT